MKGILALLTLFALVPLALAEDKDKAPAAPVKADCPLCKLPNRAALFAGTVKKCPADCAKLCCKGTEVTYLVEGMVCDRCTNKVKTGLTELKDTDVRSISHETGLVVLRYDPAKLTPAKLISTITAAGYKVLGEQAAFKIPAMNTDTGAEVVEKAIGLDQGVRKIQTVCTKTGHAVVLFDPARTSKEKLAAAINATTFKVAN